MRHVLESISIACLQEPLQHVESCLYHTATANHFLPLIREKVRTEHSHTKIGSYSVTHYLEDLPGLFPFQLLSRCSSTSYSVFTCTCQNPFPQDTHPPTELSKAVTATPLFQWERGWCFKVSPTTSKYNTASDPAALLQVVNNYPFTFLSQVQICKGRIPKDSFTDLLLRSAVVKERQIDPHKGKHYF